MDFDNPRRFASLICFVLLVLGLSKANAAEEYDAYRLGPGDEIDIQVYREDDLSMKLTVDESGVFKYPYLGVIRAMGRTVSELEQILTNGLLEDILVNPSVSVAITGYRNFYIGGEVKSPGGYAYRPGLTVRQAITVAGGPTEWAASNKFRILREGEQEPRSADQNTPVRPGDTVTILEGIF